MASQLLRGLTEILPANAYLTERLRQNRLLQQSQFLPGFPYFVSLNWGGTPAVGAPTGLTSIAG